MAGNAPSSGLILAGVQSSSGKTAIACMLIAALRARGLAVQPFKAGPDFIDPGYHTAYAGVSSRNLDTWLMGSDGVRREVARHGAGCVSILEGVMGLFDGSDVGSDEGSTMELARLLDWPVVLVLPCAKTGRSLAAMLRGFIEEAGQGRICGVIFNEVSGGSHAEYLREAIAPLKVPVLGAVPRCDELHWPERHLGLRASQEMKLPSADSLAQLAERFLDMPKLLAMLAPAPASDAESVEESFAPRRLAIAKDEAFHFYYASNLDHLCRHGIELIEFSPCRDSALPAEIEGLIFGGGFPECFAETLAQNASLRAEVRAAIDGGLPCYAECGGLMYLAEELITTDGRRFPMAGALLGGVEMTPRLVNFGYCRTSPDQEAHGRVFHGHEFHCSRWLAESGHANLWSVSKKRGGAARREGFKHGRLHASYVHLHFASAAPVIDRLFLERSAA
jgi:cobyrinic acid a,c-diamide synthase